MIHKNIIVRDSLDAQKNSEKLITRLSLTALNNYKFWLQVKYL